MRKFFSLHSDIRALAKGRFEEELVESFIATFTAVAEDRPLLGSILQISTDEGDELEVGFFTDEVIADVTLSRGRVYSYSYPLAKVKSLDILDVGIKWVLTIHGEKKFDYNVVKPGSAEILLNYETQLRQSLSLPP